MIEIKRESIQAITVTVRDTTGYVTSLANSFPVFDVYSVDDTTDANVAKVISGQKATASGLNLTCVLFPQYMYDPTGIPGYGVANSAPSIAFPLHVFESENDRFNIVSPFFGHQLVPETIYHNMVELAVGMTQALGEFNEADTYYYQLGESLGTFSWDSKINRLRFDGNSGPSGAGVDPAFNGLTIANGGFTDFLAGTGWTDGQIFFDHAVAPAQPSVAPYVGLSTLPLSVGRYRLYVSFETVNAQIPRVGPVEFFVS